MSLNTCRVFPSHILFNFVTQALHVLYMCMCKYLEASSPIGSSGGGGGGGREGAKQASLLVYNICTS